MECSKGTKVQLRFPARAETFFSHNVCGTQPGPYPEGTGRNIPVVKWPGRKAYYEVEDVWSCISTPQQTTSCYAAVKLGHFCICGIKFSEPEEI
jgi:hypothetical protein